jgi:hypothetical protein
MVFIWCLASIQRELGVSKCDYFKHDFVNVTGATPLPQSIQEGHPFIPPDFLDGN